jgi:hypothetical protein
MTDFRKALLWTAIPLVGLALVSTGGTFTPDLYFVWALDLVALLIALVVSIILVVTGRVDLSSGVIVGCAIGFLALAVTCFANVNTM